MEKRELDVTRSALGTVTPLATVSIQAQVSGQITEVAFQEGQTVHKGDFLIQIDARPYEAALAQARGQLAKDQAALEEARMDLQRYTDLVQKRSITRQQAEDQKWVVQQDEGLVRVDQAQVEAAQINVNFCRIVAPVDGRVGLRLVDPGNVVQANGGTALAVVTRMSPMTVVFALPEDDLPAVLRRLRQGARPPVEAFDRSGSTLLDHGRLLAVDSQINTSTGTVNLKAEFPNANAELFPNQFVNVVVHIDNRKDVVVAPSSGVLRGSQGSYAYVLNPDATVSMAQVRAGIVQGAATEILAGLKPGDRIVVDGADKLRDGAKVSVPDENAHASGDDSPRGAGNGAAPPPAGGTSDSETRSHERGTHGHRHAGADANGQ